MNLRKKLLTTFGGLALLGLLTAGVTTWVIGKWQISNKQLNNHYQRSLLLQRIRAATYEAFKEIPDALVVKDNDAREEFTESLEPVEADFEQWADLADTKAEKRQVKEIRKSYERLVEHGNQFFDLVAQGRRADAIAWMENQLEDEDFEDFQELTEEAVESDREYRQVVLAQVHRTWQTAQLVLALDSFGTLSLIFLLAAYLASDLFTPLRQLREAIDDVARGDLDRRLDEERSDELGAVNQAFNRMVETMEQREQLMGLAAMPASEWDGKTPNKDWQNVPSRLMLHQLVSQVRSRVSQFSQAHDSNGHSNGNSVATLEKQHLFTQELDQLLHTITRLTEFGFPLDLNLALTDIRALLYEVLLRFQEEFIQRSISFQFDIAPDVNQAVVDRLKLREALAEVVRNALNALPEQGGQLGIRATVSEGQELLIEVADNGKGIAEHLIDKAFAPLDSDWQNSSVGLKLTKAVIEQHGGRFQIDSQPDEGTYVQLYLPLRS